MNLHRTERDYYALAITTEPELTGQWEASFDRGETWVTGVIADGVWTWLVAGPDFDAAALSMDSADTQATVAADTVPWLRLADDPVLDVERGPKIELVA